jgi:hypothetical protein
MNFIHALPPHCSSFEIKQYYFFGFSTPLFQNGEELCPSQAVFCKNAPNFKLLANVSKKSFPVDIIPNLSHVSQT